MESIDFCAEFKNVINLDNELAEAREMIKEKWSFIERAEFEKIFFTSFITYYLLNSGIDPLKYMDYVPSNYLFGLSVKKFVVPDNVKYIERYAFCWCCDLEELYIPDSVEDIGARVFDKKCTALRKVRLPQKFNNLECIDILFRQEGLDISKIEITSD